MKKYANKILLIIAAIMLLCVAVEVPFMVDAFKSRNAATIIDLRDNQRK